MYFNSLSQWDALIAIGIYTLFELYSLAKDTPQTFTSNEQGMVKKSLENHSAATVCWTEQRLFSTLLYHGLLGAHSCLSIILS